MIIKFNLQIVQDAVILIIEEIKNLLSKRANKGPVYSHETTKQKMGIFMTYDDRDTEQMSNAITKNVLKTFF